MIFSNLQDDELIFFLSIQSDRANRTFLERYNSKCELLVNSFLTKNTRSLIGKEILFNVCYKSINDALIKGDLDNYKFYTYWKRISLNELTETIKKETKLNKKMVSYDKPILIKDSLVYLEDVIGCKDKKQEILMAFNEIQRCLKDEGFDMDFEEIKIFKTYLDGFTYDEIANRFPKYTKSKIFRIIKRGKSLIKERVFIR